MSSPPRHFPRNYNEEDDVGSYYGPPPGGYTPSPNKQRRQDTRQAEFHPGFQQYRHHSSSQQQYYSSYNDSRGSHSYSRPYDEFGRSYPPPNAERYDNDSRYYPYDNRKRPPQWNKWTKRSQYPVNQEPNRNVRSRTASLTDEEENERAQREREQQSIGSNGQAACREGDAAFATTSRRTDLPNVLHPGQVISTMAPNINETAPAARVPSMAAADRVRDEQRIATASSSQTPDAVARSSEQPETVPSSAAIAPANIQAENDDNEDLASYFYHEEDGDPMAFCCAKCRCSPDRRDQYGGAVSQAEEGEYYHRHCCHKINMAEVNSTWLPPLQEVQDTIQNKFVEAGENDYPKPPTVRVSKNEVIKSNASMEMQVKNNDEIEVALDLLQTNEQYCQNRRGFQRVADKRKGNLRPAVVLDVFAGVGAALVVLKRLGVAMSKVIHVEHDNIATHVVKHNHDPAYNPDAVDDGIQYIYVSRFEDLEGNIDQYLEEHGPIDIIVGGPPCTDYSGINARAQGPAGAQGQFLPRFANLIEDIRTKQPGHPVYYLIENVVFIDSSREDNYNLIQNITGVVETKQDALYFSPCRRNRSFWLNIPLEDSTHGYKEAAAIKPSTCLEEGWAFPTEDEMECAKVNTFLASKGRINDDRMVKYKPSTNNKYEKGYFSALERERMLGFPEGYTKTAVEHLFVELLNNAYDLHYPDETRPDSLWKNKLDPKYFCFVGEPVRYEEAYDETAGMPFVRILMSPPEVTMNRDFFNAEDYSKHLLGNSFSIPVVEYLLTRLREVFASREYDGYDYKYRWEEDGDDA